MPQVGNFLLRLPTEKYQTQSLSYVIKAEILDNRIRVNAMNVVKYSIRNSNRPKTVRSIFHAFDLCNCSARILRGL